MKLKPETLEKLRVILKEDFGQEVSDQELHDVAFNLLGYFDTLMQCHYEDIAVVEAPVTQYDNEPKRQEA